MVRASPNLDGGPPNTVIAILQTDWRLLPLGEVAHQQHAFRSGGGKGKSLGFPAAHSAFCALSNAFLCHLSFSVVARMPCSSSPVVILIVTIPYTVRPLTTISGDVSRNSARAISFPLKFYRHITRAPISNPAPKPIPIDS